MLRVSNATVYYGKAMAIKDVSLEVPEGAVVGILGANGAGKSTVMRAISGLVSLTSGEIWFGEMRMDTASTTDIVKAGIVQVPEGRRLFPHLTVLSNLKLGASLRTDKDGIKSDLEAMFKRFPILGQRRKQKAGTLSGGEQQMLAIARGLMARPKLLLLDEPTLGLAPKVIEELGDVILEINQSGVGVLLVEQNIPLALRVASTGYAIQVGRVVLEGDIAQFQSEEFLKKAYLGG
ncbi:MAG: ABC transporter ATP-binding protein [Armatimonadetes bacterium]|nr:ABC transporter ATP-binding protein [Armatimonadota bacterium]